MELFENTAILAVMATLGAFLFIIGIWFGFHKELTSAYNSAADKYRDTFVLELQYPNNVPKVFGMYLLATLVACLLGVLINPVLVIFVLAIAYFLPGIVYDAKKMEKIKRVNQVLPNVLQQLAANTKNTGSISMALQEVAITAPKPMDYELALISRQEQELKSFTKALANARERLDSQWFDIVTAVLITADEKGGKASAALDNLSKVFQQLIKMQNRIDTATAQGRMSMKMMLAMPFVVIGIVYMVDPGLLALAVSNTAGKVMLGAATVFYLGSLFLAIWLSKVKL
ncbi:hypothetical protein GCM10007939_22260 [Amylibacter marinus]|uniref:Type II secretion system protein GspF domain-containing protein n=1 Tax=Amylibacter marinus TaxID=1475483 RepID=A0ABQ5VXK7_9RHOB|nr:type II secretion system F family protein [Amylibacter marinus]GLQ35942.1 hypothetical protein GCM10007939_22260 [Amylibacter marinus]